MLYKCTKILKIIEQEWGEDSDLYGSAEEACIYGGYNALLKVLEDYDCMDYADDDYKPMSDENMSYTYPTYPDDDNEPEPLDENKKSNNMKKQTIKLNESQLRNIIRKTLNEYHDIDDDTYFGGGLPDKQSAQRITYEKEIKNILKEMEPFIDKLCEIYNNTECDNGSYDKVMDVLSKLEILYQTASDFYELDLP